MTALAPGRVLGERFELERLIGRGGMGEAWLVFDRELEERVVAKVVPGEATPDKLTLLRRECKHARKLVHRNIARVYDFHRTSGTVFITMAHVEGTSIDSLRGRPLDELLPPLTAIADAVHYAHEQGIVHRDLKAANILLDRAGEPHILDFGISDVVPAPAGGGARGGGTRGSASPEQRAGAVPSVADDVYAFGMLARDLASGVALPSNLTTLLTASTNRDPRHRPTSMAEVKHALEETSPTEVAPPTSPPRLTPPPKVIPPATVRARPFGDPGKPSAVAPEAPSSGGVGIKTIAAFLLLLGVAFGVFFVLPRFAPSVTEGGPPRSPAATLETSEIEPEPTQAEPPDVETLVQAKARAEELAQQARSRKQSLEQRSVGAWGNDLYREALAHIVTADEQHGRRDFDAAASSFQSAIEKLDRVQEHGAKVLAEALARGSEALDDGTATEAVDAFETALRVKPGHPQATRGLARAKIVDQLRSVLAGAHALEQRGDLEGAAESYQRAMALDGSSRDAQQGLARVDAEAASRAFTAAMTEAVSALNRKDYPAARSSFDKAGALRPGAPDVASGLEAVEEGVRADTIATARSQAEELERQESWRAAQKQYQRVLDIDRTIRFAQDGVERTRVRADLSDALDYHIGQSARLSDEAVLQEATGVLEQAESMGSSGARLATQVSRLTDLVAEYSTSVQVHLLSDNHTEVVVYKVGTIGKFDRHDLVLRPGTYTVIGRRQGYRDVRHRLVVRANEAPAPLVVRCEEEI